MSQYLMSVECGREYELELRVDKRRVRTFIDGKPFHDIEVKPVMAEPLYIGAALCKNRDVIIKAVNVLDQPQKAVLELRGLKKRDTSGEGAGNVRLGQGCGKQLFGAG